MNGDCCPRLRVSYLFCRYVFAGSLGEVFLVTEPGVVFTKDWVVDLVLDVVGYTVDNDLLAGCVVEPSCGDGAFLGRIVTRLCERAKRVGSLSVENLKPCVRAFDLDDASVSASKMTIRRALVRFGLSENDSKTLSDVWVSQGDFLMANVPAARWVVGNPPYVRSSLIPREQRKAYCELMSCVTMGSDLYVGFFEKSLEALTEDGALCFICSDRWLQNRYGSRLRAFVSKRYSLDVHIRLHGVSAFEDDVSAYPAITLIRRGAGRPMRYMECRPRFSLSDVPAAERWIASGEGAYRSENASADVLRPLSGSGSIPLAAPEKLQLLGDLASRYPRLEDAGVKLGIGIASGCDEVYITEDPDLVERDRMLPLFFMRDWRAGRREATKYLVNPWNEDGTLVNLDDYPRLRGYFEENEERLRRRRVAKDHPDAWYRTLDKPDQSLMGKEMLLFPDMAARADPVYSDGSRYPHHNCYWMTSSEWDVRSLGGLMMSGLVEGYVDAFGVKMRGSTLRFQAQYLRKVHIPYADEVDEDTKRELAEAFMAGNRERANSASRRAYGLEEAHA